MSDPALDPLFRRLAYHFTDPSLVARALTHRSVSSRNNERLEFLGDAILGSVIAEELYRRFPDAQEGALSRMRAALVKGTTLAEVARELDLGEFLNLGSGELKSGGFRRESILACALEALIGAVYLDGGDAACRKLLKQLFQSRLDDSLPGRVEKDPKTRLQEYLQGQGDPLPEYQLIKVEGEAHSQLFFVECTAKGLARPGRGQGNSRRRAEQKAARMALELLTAEKVQ